MSNTPETAANAASVQTFFPWNDGTMQFAELAYRNWLQGAETVQSQVV